MRGAAVYVIPLRVGGGTRIKAYEAMAAGRAVVSTAIGIEGLDLEPERHFLLADQPQDFAAAVLRLLRDAALRARLATAARDLVERHFSSRAVAAVFETICLDVLQRRSGALNRAVETAS
jgi:glycosyltransferase involved in cell wall biosynthesis